MKPVLALDPGTEQTGYVIWDGERVISHGIKENDAMIDGIVALALPDELDCVIEAMSCYGARVGRETFEAIHWSGRFYQLWRERGTCEPDRIERREVKKHLCGSATANDAAIWAVLTDRFGSPGKKSSPGILYGVTSHQRAALALAVTWWDKQLEAKDQS